MARDVIFIQYHNNFSIARKFVWDHPSSFPYILPTHSAPLFVECLCAINERIDSNVYFWYVCISHDNWPKSSVSHDKRNPHIDKLTPAISSIFPFNCSKRGKVVRCFASRNRSPGWHNLLRHWPSFLSFKCNPSYSLFILYVFILKCD